MKFKTIIFVVSLSSCANFVLSISALQRPTVERLQEKELSLPLFKHPISFLNENLPFQLSNVIGPIKGTAYYWVLNSFLTNLPSIEFLPRYTWKDRPKSIFFPTEKDKMRSTMGKEGTEEDDDTASSSTLLYYCSIPITQLPVSILNQLDQLDQFKSISQQEQQHSLPPHGALWLSSPGINAAMHFDSSDNLLTQITGFKKVILVSPEYWRELHMFSSIHPLTRQSQLAIEDGPWAFQMESNKLLTNHDSLEEEEEEEYSDKHYQDTVEELHNKLMEYNQDVKSGDRLQWHNDMIREIDFEYHVLSPGDVLKIPPFYFHSVSISASDEQTSISLNNYATYQEHKEVLATIYKYKLKRQFLKQSIDFLAWSLGMDLGKLSRDILKSRWYNIENNGDSFLAGNVSNATNFYFEDLFIDVGSVLRLVSNQYEHVERIVENRKICDHFHQRYGNQFLSSDHPLYHQHDLLHPHTDKPNDTRSNNNNLLTFHSQSNNLNGDENETEAIKMKQHLAYFVRLRLLVPDAFEMLFADYLEVAIAKTIGGNKVKSLLYCLGYQNQCRS